MRVTFCNLKMIKWRYDKKKKPIPIYFISKLLPFKTTMDNPIIKSYIRTLQHVKFGL